MLRHLSSPPSAARACLAVAVAVVVPAAATGGPGVAAPEPGQAASPRVVAVGDVHGAADELRALLRQVRLIDDAGSWSGGEAVLVQTGDFMDRGAAVREVMELLIRLQGEAHAAGGEVVVLLGNHEVMNLVGALQYVSPESLAAFAERDAETRQREAFADYERRVLRRHPDWKRASSAARRQVADEWLAAHPVGWVEYLESLGPEGSFGRWLRSLPAIHRRDGYLFLHAGIPPELSGWGVAEINARVAEEIAAVDRYRARLWAEGRLPAVADLQDLLAAADARVGGLADLAGDGDEGLPPLPGPASGDVDPRSFYAPLGRLDDWFLFAPEGPLWFRGYARWDFFEVQERLPAILEALDARTIVTGHTPQPEGIRVRAGGGLYLVDTGMLQSVYEGRGEALVLEGGSAVAVTSTGERRVLPSPRAATAAVSPHR